MKFSTSVLIAATCVTSAYGEFFLTENFNDEVSLKISFYTTPRKMSKKTDVFLVFSDLYSHLFYIFSVDI